MVFEQFQLISFGINMGIILLGIVLTILIIWGFKIKQKNSKLLFILFMLYWIGPLMTQDYTGLIQLNFGLDDHGLLLIWPLLAYGLVGIIWRPLSEILVFSFKSRKKILYMSLVIQAICIIPMIIRPTLTTNIIQSVGAGVGASGIAIFNLMFNEADARRKALSVVSILSLPPLLAQIFASGLMSIVTTFESGSFVSKESFVGTLWWIWILAAVFIVVCFVLVFFVKEEGDVLYRNNVDRRPIKTKREYTSFIFLCLMALFTTLIKWATAGPTASVQIAYLGYIQYTDTRFYEGYCSFIFTIGQFIGTFVTDIILTKSKKDWKMPLVIASIILWFTYLLVSSFFVNVGVFMLSNIINGLAFGIITPLILSLVLDKFFTKTQRVTPVGIYNLFLSIGICAGNAIHCVLKTEIFDQLTHFTVYGFEDFRIANLRVNMICCLFATLILVCYIINTIIFRLTPPSDVTQREIKTEIINANKE